MSSRLVMVTGGGTSGHVLPALAIMDRLLADGHDRASLRFVGTRHGIDERLLAATGYQHELLDVVGLQRSLSRRNVVFLPKLIRATWRMHRLMRAERPAVVVNVGGYASMPATLAAVLRRVPIVVVSYDLRPGLASKLAARFAVATAAAFPGSVLPRAHTTGAPIRREIIAVDRNQDKDAARASLGLPSDRFVVAVFGGSLGAKAVNGAVARLVELSSERSDLAIHHVVGDRWLRSAAPARDGAAGIMYHVIGYEDRMPMVYAASDLLVVRAGASTIAEVAATGSVAVLVPWPGAAENHQLANARTLSTIGAAVLVEEIELSGERLLAEIDRLRVDHEAFAAIASAAYAAGERHRGDSLIDLIREVTGR